jgi:hypothetical protein
MRSIVQRSAHCAGAVAGPSSVGRVVVASSRLTTRSAPLRPTSAAAFSSAASYDKTAYQNMPNEPQFALPTDAPAGTFELFYFALVSRRSASPT